MTVFVDRIIQHDLAGKPAQVQSAFKNGACHMFTDGPLEELHAMAALVGMRRSWFQDGDLPHYDLNPQRRMAAVFAGAVECDKHKTVAVMRANRIARASRS